VSHELNNPLSIVVAQAVMMERQAADPRMAERAAKIRKAADRCAKIVQTFLAMARQKPPQREQVDLNAVVLAALDLTEYGLRTHGVKVTRELAPTLPALSADADQLHQVLINLIINAQHAMQEQDSPRELHILTYAADDGRVVLEVGDNGPGVPRRFADGSSSRSSPPRRSRRARASVCPSPWAWSRRTAASWSCWTGRAGPPSASAFRLALGPKLRRPNPSPPRRPGAGAPR
jgi:light-regulated signal transduction histidine kinase (bacteriophytochrome)